MTINVGLVTSEALILGCDSTASSGDYYLDPFVAGMEKDADGNIAFDADGKATTKFDFGELQHIVTDAWGGVTKMFPLCSKYCNVAAVTAGAASLNKRIISSLAAEYHGKPKVPGKSKKQPRTVKEVAEGFLEFMRAEYDEHYRDSDMPESAREGPEFLIGGFGQNDKFPVAYRVRVKQGTAKEEFASGKSSLIWNAQSDAVERVIRGYDTELRKQIEKAATEAIKAYQVQMNQAALKIVDDILKALNQKMPEGVDTTLPGDISVTLPWQTFRLGVPYSVLPLQEAVNFVSYLILLQAGKSRFARGVATVGGRTHIGVITKDKGYRQLNEPDLTHHYIGFADDH
jgi:hypothetical protein